MSDDGNFMISYKSINWIFFCDSGKHQNAYVESFNGRLRDECLNEHWFPTLLHARTSIESWRRDYNEERSKRVLGGLTPAQYAAELAGKRDRISTGR